MQISTDRVTGQDATIGRVRLFVSTASFKSTDFAFDFFACYGPWPLLAGDRRLRSQVKVRGMVSKDGNPDLDPRSRAFDFYKKVHS